MAAEREDSRQQALEEAIAACRAQQVSFASPEYSTGQPLASFTERFACNQCIEAIRALIGPRTEPPAAPAQPQAERTVRVRIAVAVASNGDYRAYGHSDWGDDGIAREAEDAFLATGGSHVSFVVADAPLPPSPATIQGEVQ